MTLWNVSDGTVRRRLFPDVLEYALCVAFSLDSNTLAYGCGFPGAATRGNGRLFLWRESSPDEQIPLVGHSGGVTSVAFSPDGSLLASASGDRAVRIWHVAAATNLYVIEGHAGRVNAVAFSPDGTLLASGSADGTTRIWRVSDQALRHVLQSGHTTGVAFAPDGQTLYVVASETIQFWRVSDGKLLQTYDVREESRGAKSIATSPDGNFFAYGHQNYLALARVPILIARMTRDSNATVLEWQGGSGRYQVQQRTSLTTGDWQNAGPPTTSTAFTNGVSGGTSFYRIQSLPD